MEGPTFDKRVDCVTFSVCAGNPLSSYDPLDRMTTGASARLKLGITTVGTWVLLSIAGLTLLSSRPVAEIATMAVDLSRLSLASWITLYLLVQLPFDWVGGVLFARRFDPPGKRRQRFWRSWLRGALVQGLFFWGVGCGLMTAARYGGFFFSLMLIGLLICCLIGLQRFMLHLVSGLRLDGDGGERRTGLLWRECDCEEIAFSGGVIGWFGHERIVVPRAWKRLLSPSQFLRLIDRRHLQITSGQRSRGVLVAGGWIWLGAILALLLEGGEVARPLDVVRFSLWMTLWQFLGLLLLPTLSRNATFSLDQQQTLLDGGPGNQVDFITATSRLTEGEQERNQIVEAIFHPLPSVTNRIKALDQHQGSRGAWNANRMMLYLAWASLGLLSRAVHCNVGRPLLWILPPVD